MGIRVSRLLANHPAELGDGAAVVASLPQRQRQRIPVVDLVGTQLNRLAIFLDGVNQVLGGAQGVREGHVEVRVVGAQADCCPEFGHTLVEFAGLGERHGKPSVGVGVIGSQLEDFLIFGDGPRHVSRLEQRDSQTPCGSRCPAA